jgi:branched-chain amino acid transport system ATP-binding protein
VLAGEGLSKRFGGLSILAGISFRVRAGTVLALIGPNGAGKTTLFNILTGFVRPDAGRVVFDGRDITALAPERRAGLGIARTFQVVKPFSRLTVLENVMVGAFAIERRIEAARGRANDTLDRVGIAAIAHQRAGHLTVAHRKKMELARCLAMSPQLLLLDEVMSGLNSSELLEMVTLVRTLRAEGMTIVLVEHLMDVVRELADEILVLSGGAFLAQGAPQEVLDNPAVIAAYLGEVPAHATG